MNFKNVPKKYRPIPFWSWNEKLDETETARQVKMMDKAGMGGFFMHARGGLQTEYMGEEWFLNVSSATKAAKECGMRPWAYDENGWPSGFGNGAVSGLGVSYQQKYLRMEEEFLHSSSAICKNGGYYFYYDINPFYVDVLDKKVIKEFIDRIYKPYYDKYKGEIEGFFTDEPQISRNGIPWSFVFEEEYNKRYGEDIKNHLCELFLEVGNYKDTRLKFWKMVTDLFSSSYMKQIYDWCSEHNLKLTGHLVLEETLNSQLTTNGACMPHYEYFHIPGMDWLGRNIYDCLTCRQVGSVAAQLGKEAVLSETFALCGHNVSFSELKGIYEWQMVRGVTLLCQHLEGYSLRGMRKRDYPPAMYYQQPWWHSYDKFNEAMARIGMVLNEGEEKPDVLVFHPMSSAWVLYNGKNEEEIAKLNQAFVNIIKKLEEKHIDFHLADETIMERHASVKNGKIIIGKMQYGKVIMPPINAMLPSSEKLLLEFKSSGGSIVTPDEIQNNPAADNKHITYTARYFKDFKVHYFVNTNSSEQKAHLGVCGKKLDISNGELLKLNKNYVFEPWGSLVVIEDGSLCVEEKEKAKNYIFPDGKFKVCGRPQNALTLDKCDYYFDGVLQEKNGYVLNITERAGALKKKVKIKQDYFVSVNYIPENLYLVCEKPENYEISVNGKGIAKTDAGYFADVSFRKIDIAKYLVLGENKISFCCDFVQSKEFYESVEKARKFESELNKLVYDMEIEAVYLVGDFSVKTDGVWEKLPKNVVRYSGGFSIEKPAKTITLNNIEKQGFPFFCGSLTAEKEVEINENTYLKVSPKGVNAITVSVGKNEETMIFGNGEFYLGKYFKKGTVTLKITLTNNLRNLLGPHHMQEGECFEVGPYAFYKEPCVWNLFNPVEWNEGYCLAEFGINRE